MSSINSPDSAASRCRSSWGATGGTTSQTGRPIHTSAAQPISSAMRQFRMTNLRSLSITAKARGMQSSISRMFKADAKQGDCANSTPGRAPGMAASDGMSIGILAGIVWWQEEFAKLGLRLDDFFQMPSSGFFDNRSIRWMLLIRHRWIPRKTPRGTARPAAPGQRVPMSGRQLQGRRYLKPPRKSRSSTRVTAR